MALTIGQASRAVDLSYQRYVTKASEPESKYKKYFNFRTTTDYYEKDSGLSGLGVSSFVDENAVIVEDVPVQTYAKTYTQTATALIVGFSWQVWKFGIKKRDLDIRAQEMKRADARKREKLCAEYLTNGFEATSYAHADEGGQKTITISGGDSLGPFDDDHTREDGGTNINNIVYDGTTYNLPFDYSGLKSAHRTSSLFVDARGNPQPANLDTVVCKKASSVAFKAKEINGALRMGKIPESFDNDGAGAPAYKIIELDYLTEDARWFMFDSSLLNDPRTYGFQFIESEPITVAPSNQVYKTMEIQVRGHSIFAHGHNDVARMWVGSRGTSAAPTD